MRQVKAVTIGEYSIPVRELLTSDVCVLFETNDGLQTLVGILSGLPGDTIKLMRMSVDVSSEEFDRLIENINTYTILEDAFREVNAPFFASLPRKMEAMINLGSEAAKKMGVSLKSPAYSLKKGT